jgi:hypothetical protein
MRKNEKEMFSALLQCMSTDLQQHMEEEYGDEWLAFRDKYYFAR